jgi:hypothetical protein
MRIAFGALQCAAYPIVGRTETATLVPLLISDKDSVLLAEAHS